MSGPRAGAGAPVRLTPRTRRGPRPSVYAPRGAAPGGEEPAMATMTRDEAYGFIDAGPPWAILTTVGPGGYPHAVPLAYYRDGDALFVNARGARLANMRRHRQVSLLLESGTEMGELRGLLIEGDAELVAEPAEVLRLSRLAGRARGASEEELPAEPRPGMIWARIAPRRMRSWDNSKRRERRPGAPAR